MSSVIVDVMLKPEIHDPQGEAVLSASRRLGFGGVTRVRQGKRFEVEIDGPADTTALAAIEELARELLANPVIEEFSLHTAELPGRRFAELGRCRVGCARADWRCDVPWIA